MASQITSVETEIVPGPPIHGLVLPQEASCTLETSDYETASSISVVISINTNATTQDKNCCGLTNDHFKRAIKIKPRYIPSKLAYYFFYAARSTLATYFIIFLTSTGLNPEQVGLIQGIRMLVFTSGGMFWGLLADKSNKRLPIMLVQATTFAGLLFSKPWVAHWINSRETAEEHREHVISAVQSILAESSNSTNIESITSQRTTKQISQMFDLDWSPHHYKTGSAPLFISMLVIGMFSAFFGGGIQIMLDSKVMDFTAKTSNNRGTYGRQRLWGSVAYSITPAICGAIIETVPENSISVYMPVFYFHIGLMCTSIICFVVLFRQDTESEALAKQGSSPKEETNTTVGTTNEEEQNVLRFIFRTFKNPHMMIFLLNVLAIGIGNSLQWAFQFIYMEEMNASKTLMGFCAMTQCGAEAIFFPLSAKIGQKIGGNKAAISAGILGYGFIFTAFALIDDPVWMPMVTSIVGFTYTLFHIASNDTLYKASNPRCVTTLYALYNGVLIGLGGALSGVIGGVIYKNVGGRVLFMMSGGLFFFVGAINVAYTIYYRKLPNTNVKQHKKIYKQFMDVYIEEPPQETTPEPPEKTEQEQTVHMSISDEAIVIIDESTIV